MLANVQETEETAEKQLVIVPTRYIETYYIETYYIETSKGSITFQSPDISNLEISRSAWASCRAIALQCKNIESPDELVSVLESLYDFEEVSVTCTSENVWFLKIRLSNSCHGNPEYKIYSS